MEDSDKCGDLTHVPWLSIYEWYHAYELIYRNNGNDLVQAYEILRTWKARVPKLPVQIDCTLTIIQIYLCDREWTPKLNKGELPIYYEYNLCLMYSIGIMRLLNCICDIAGTKEISLLKMANNLKIPEGIVHLRHDIAHGDELPYIEVMRTAVNILFAWLHDEYWCVEAKTMKESYLNQLEALEFEKHEVVEKFSNLIELWSSVSLYNLADYSLVKDIPDAELRGVLEDLNNSSNNKSLSLQNNDEGCSSEINDCKYKLVQAKSILLEKLSRFMAKSNLTASKEDAILHVLLNNGTFLPTNEFLQIFLQDKNKNYDELEDIPPNMERFWQDIIVSLHENKIIEKLLFKLYDLLQNDCETNYRKFIASLWIKSILTSFYKLNMAQQISRKLQCEAENLKDKSYLRTSNLKVKEQVSYRFSNLDDVVSLGISNQIPQSIFNKNFIHECVLNINEYSAKFIPILLKIDSNLTKRQTALLSKLTSIYTSKPIKEDNIPNQIYTIEDFLEKLSDKNIGTGNIENSSAEIINSVNLMDQTIWNPQWKLELRNYKCTETPVGILSWQIDSVEMLPPFHSSPQQYNMSTSNSGVMSGIFDSNNLKMKSKVKWDNMLRKKKRIKKNRRGANTVNKAMKIIYGKNL